MRRLPGEEGVWIIIFGDMLVFSVMFGSFMSARRTAPSVFAQSRDHLNQSFGLVNTGFMLVSSWCVANAVRASRQADNARTVRYLQLALACGGGFVVTKLFEYAQKIRAGIVINSNDFYTFYFMLTGIHFAHVLIAMGVLTLLSRRAKHWSFTAQERGYLESGASFWHLVDLLWIILFALLYLLK